MKRIYEDRPLTDAERHQRWIAKSGNKEQRKIYLQKWNANNKERNRLRKSTPEAKAAKKAHRQREETRVAERIRDINRLRDPSKRAGRLHASAKGRAKNLIHLFRLPLKTLKHYWQLERVHIQECDSIFQDRQQEHVKTHGHHRLTKKTPVKVTL